MRNKESAFQKDWKAQITGSTRRSSVFKSIHTIHALGCQVHEALYGHRNPHKSQTTKAASKLQLFLGFPYLKKAFELSKAVAFGEKC